MGGKGMPGKGNGKEKSDGKGCDDAGAKKATAPVMLERAHTLALVRTITVGGSDSHQVGNSPLSSDAEMKSKAQSDSATTMTVAPESSPSVPLQNEGSDSEDDGS